MEWFRRFFTSCFATKPMLLCCVPRVKESTSTRFLYCCILTVVSILSVIFHTGGLAHSTATRMVCFILVQNSLFCLVGRYDVRVLQPFPDPRGVCSLCRLHCRVPILHTFSNFTLYSNAIYNSKQ